MAYQAIPGSSSGAFTPGGANRIAHANSGGTALTDTANFTWDSATRTITFDPSGPGSVRWGSGICNVHAPGSQGMQVYQSASTTTPLAGFGGLGVAVGGSAGQTATVAPIEVANTHASTSDFIAGTKAGAQRIVKRGSGDLTVGTAVASDMVLITGDTERARLVNSSSGQIKLSAGWITANGTDAVAAIGSVGPDVLSVMGWLTLLDNSNNVRYIPLYGA